MGLRSSINRNLTDIVELHEEILGELHRVVPNSEYTQPECIPVIPKSTASKSHNRWRSLDSTSEDDGVSSSWLQGIPSVVAEPAIAAEVAHVFGKRVCTRFLSNNSILGPTVTKLYSFADIIADESILHLRRVWCEI